MNIKRLSTFVVGIFLLQTTLPVLAASEVKQPTTEQATVKYAPVHPTPEITIVAKTRSNNEQRNLASTGYYSTIAIFGLALISIMLITLKKIQINDEK